MQQRRIVRILDVGGERLFAPVEPDEVGALAMGEAVVGAGEIALGALDLDHPGAGVGEPGRAVGRGHGLLHRHDQDAVQGQCLRHSVDSGKRRRKAAQASRDGHAAPCGASRGSQARWGFGCRPEFRERPDSSDPPCRIFISPQRRRDAEAKIKNSFRIPLRLCVSAVKILVANGP